MDHVFNVVKNKYHLPFELKKEQFDVISLLCDGMKNVLAFWPTGFGKSALYMVTPLMLYEVEL